MANSDAPSGLTPAKHLTGGVIRPSVYSIASGYATSIFTGQLVKSTGTTKGVNVCAATERAVGVFAGCQYIDASGDFQFRPYWPASTTVLSGTTVQAFVYDDPEILFEIQASAGMAVTDIGSVADITGTSGSTTTGQSTQELDSSTLSASGSAQLKVYELVNRPDNDYGTNAKVLVLINEHEMKAAMTAV
jgi:hypothetical protein